MSNLIQMCPDTGLVMVDSSTGLVMAASIYGGPGIYCPDCEYPTKKYIRATFENISCIVDGCYDCGESRDVEYSGTFDVNGSYVLKQSNSNPCIWLCYIDVNITVTTYNSTDGSCSGGIYSQRNITSIRINVEYLGFNDISIGLGAAGFLWFKSSITTWLPSCVEVVDLANKQTSGLGCQYTGPIYAGIGGTVTVEEID